MARTAGPEEIAMHVNRGLLGWGVFFIALGGVPIAVQAGAIDAAAARRAWELWPMILIGIGLGLALRNTPVAALGGVVVALSFGLMAGGLLAGGFGSTRGFALCGVGSGGAAATEGTAATGVLGTPASVDLAVDCGAITVSTAAGSGWTVGWATTDGSAPKVTASESRLAVEAGQGHGFGVASPTARWHVTLPEEPELRVTASVNAGSAEASLGAAHVTSLDASVNAGDGRFDLGSAVGTQTVSASVNVGSLALALPVPSGTLTGTLSANAGTLAVCVPAGTPVRIRVDTALGATNFAQRGMTESGGFWTRGAYGDASSRIDLVVSANLGTITLDPEDGCG